MYITQIAASKNVKIKKEIPRKRRIDALLVKYSVRFPRYVTGRLL